VYSAWVWRSFCAESVGVLGVGRRVAMVCTLKTEVGEVGAIGTRSQPPDCRRIPDRAHNNGFFKLAHHFQYRSQVLILEHIFYDGISTMLCK
jgi:hypothetical protein